MWSIKSIESIENSFFVHLPTGAIPVLFNSGFLFLYFHRLLFPTVAPLILRHKIAKNHIFSQKSLIFCLTILRAGVYYMTSVRDIAQPGLARLTGGQKVRSSNLRIPTIFLPKFGQKNGQRRRKSSLYAFVQQKLFTQNQRFSSLPRRNAMKPGHLHQTPEALLACPP